MTSVSENYAVCNYINLVVQKFSFLFLWRHHGLERVCLGFESPFSVLSFFGPECCFCCWAEILIHLIFLASSQLWGVFTTASSLYSGQGNTYCPAFVIIALCGFQVIGCCSWTLLRSVTADSRTHTHTHTHIHPRTQASLSIMKQLNTEPKRNTGVGNSELMWCHTL